MGNAAQYLSVDLPNSVQPGQQFTGTITFKNVGDTTWTPGIINVNSGYKLGSQNSQDNVIWGGTRQLLPNVVNPNETVVIPLTLTAPADVGVYTCYWKVVQEGVEWFGDTGGKTITVEGEYVTPVTLSDKQLPIPDEDYPNGLIGAEIINTGPFNTQLAKRIHRWTNNSGFDILIKKSYLWTGVQGGAIADVHVQANRLSDGSWLNVVQWDRYAEPTAPNNHKIMDYDPYMVLKNNDSIDIMFYADVFNGSIKKQHHSLIIWFQYVTTNQSEL